MYLVQGITVDSRVAEGAPPRTYNNEEPAFRESYDSYPAETDDFEYENDNADL